ncbi:uncharacterized protein EI97DRAFT_248698 [Westerdykella ornata]|uniref:Uncharacterized protein n=1 Tax=Westerdykella ornata TaxID=318751 RepID=A0A6A6JPQ5_WESOR|nr:uncharacterized protein EI97DRAFT_248698 [Westerdykella ornata]KAF2278244.1 hypothetical protein EI97DRAFT_248698 [Westerdykella ornata]
MPFLNGTRGHSQLPAAASKASSSNGSHVHGSGDSRSSSGSANSMANSDPIAVIGISLKFPQSTTDVSSFWDLLIRGGSTRTEVPPDRYNGEAFYRPKDNGNKTGTSKTKHGHFIAESLDAFDAPFFSITPHEAECMDPQQRWLLESTYHAIENAGLSLGAINKTDTCVYVGCFMNDHEAMVYKDLDIPNSYHATASASAILANRISWFYNLRGPSVSVNTACSGSLVALHLACQSLRSGESAMGLVCGTNLLFSPESTVGLSNLNFLSPDGQCYSFDERANGYSRGEGIATLVIKPLSAAIRDHDPIRAIIRATGVNSDGRTPGISQPSSEAQISLMRDTYSRFGLDPSLTRYFEAHGTGTQVGDPIEAESIAAVFTENQRSDHLMYVGAVKSNIGHLEGASGLAGVIKAILVLEHGAIPPNHFPAKINPAIKDDWRLVFPTRQLPWPQEGLRRASVNSFGFGGTNAHVVLDDARSAVERGELLSTKQTFSKGNVTVSAPKLLVWSAFDEAGVRRQLEAYNAYFSNRANRDNSDEGAYFDSLVHTLSNRRTHHPWRSFAICDGARALSKLEFSSPVRVNPKLRLCFVFTGQGAQWQAMGEELLAYEAFRQSLEDSDAILRQIGCQFSVFDKLYTNPSLRKEGKEGKGPDVDLPEFCQPICTALQIALVELLLHWQVNPYAVIGHSSGEVAAAFAAGLISKRYALELALFRGVAVAATMQANKRQGGMMAVRLTPDTCETVLSRHLGDRRDAIRIACYNSPQNLTLSGDIDVIEKVQPLLEAEGIMARRLAVGVAYHNSVHMSDAAKLYQTFIRNSHPGDLGEAVPVSPRCLFVSSLRGTLFEPGSDASEVSSHAYWIDNLVCPVRFADGVQTLAASLDVPHAMLDAHFLEVGPHSTLKSAIKESLPKGWSVEKCYTSILYRQQPALSTALPAAGRLFSLGYPIDLERVNSPSSKLGLPKQVLTDLPSYQFDRSRPYWLESRISKNYRFRRFPHNDLLGTPVSDWNPLEAQWNHRITLQDAAFVKDHQVSGTPVYPAAGMLIMALEAAQQLDQNQRRPKGYRFKEVRFTKSIVVPNDKHGVETQFRLRKQGDEGGHNESVTWYDFRLHVYDHGAWVLCCHGAVAVEYRSTVSAKPSKLTQEDEMDAGPRPIHVPQKAFYAHLQDAGLQYGPYFQATDDLHYEQGTRGSGVVDMDKWTSLSQGIPSPCLVHPASLDCIFQMGFLGIAQGASKQIDTLVPTEVKELWISAERHEARDSDTTVRVFAESIPDGRRGHRVDLTALYTDDNRPFLVGDITLTSIGSAAPLAKRTENAVSLYQVQWKPDINLLPRNFFAHANNQQPTANENVRLTEYVCYIGISEVLQQIGHDESIIAQLPQHLQKHLLWMRHEVEKVNASASWQSFLQEQERSCVSRESLFEKVQSFGPEGRLIVKLAKVLVPIMRGKEDPLQVLFEDKTLSDYYRLENPPPEVLAGIQKYVECLVHLNPHMRILEIGAGTGGMTRGVLKIIGGQPEREELPQFTEYMFTDVSPAFFGAAKKNFGFGRDGFRCKVLDIEKDPEQQGFEVDSYDLIIASNVLHATRDLSVTLKNARKILKSGGKMILVEGISSNLMRTSFIFGLLHGWWLSSETFREWGPLVPLSRWESLLQQSHFTGADTVIDGIDEASCLSSAIVTTASPLQLCSEAVRQGTGLVVIRSEESALQMAIATKVDEIARPFGIRVESIDAHSWRDPGSGFCIFLQTMDRFSFPAMSQREAAVLRNVFKPGRRLLWVTSISDSGLQDNEQDAAIGLARSIRSELESIELVTLGLQRVKEADCAARNIWSVLKQYFGVTSDAPATIQNEEIVEVDGVLCISRLLQARKLQTEVQSVNHRMQNELQPEILPPSSGLDVEIDIRAIGLHPSRVIPTLSSSLPATRRNIYAGYINKVGDDAKTLFKIGDKVIAISSHSTLNSKGHFPTYQTHHLPEGIDFEVAAAGLDYLAVAYDALCNWAHIQKDTSVLVLVEPGQAKEAMIHLASVMGAKVFITADPLSSDRFPFAHQLKDNEEVSYQIKKLTGGRGTDVVIGSDQSLDTCWECVAPYGQIVQLISSGSEIRRTKGRKNVAFVTLDPTELFGNHDRAAATLSKVSQLISEKTIPAQSSVLVVSPAKLKGGSATEILEPSVSRVVLSITPGDNMDDLVPSSTIQFSPNATYAITGGLGGLGKSIAKFMVSRGARNLLLLSRQGGDGETAKPFVDALRASGVTVFAPKCDIGDEKTVSEVFREAEKNMPPIKGCIQGSMVLRSAMFQNMTLEQWVDTLRPKVQGTLNVYKYLPEVDFLICLSSVCGIIGASGQSNYAFGCAYQDALARSRAGSRKNVISIDLGIVEDVGYTAEHKDADRFMRSLGMQPIPESYIHALLAYYGHPSNKVLDRSEAQIVAGIMNQQEMQRKGISRPKFLARPLFRHLQHVPPAAPKNKTPQTQKVASTEPTAKSEPLNGSVRNERTVINAICQRLSDVLELTVEDIDPGKPLHAFGVDSLVAIEIRTWFAEALQADVPVFDILSNISIEALASKIVGETK